MTQFLFRVADFFAWSLVILGLLLAVTFPFFGPVLAQMDHETLPRVFIVGICLVSICIALGAYGIIRRRLMGLALLMAIFSVAVASSAVAVLIVCGVVFLVFGTPFALVLVQTWSGQASEPQQKSG